MISDDDDFWAVDPRGSGLDRIVRGFAILVVAGIVLVTLLATWKVLT